MQPPQISIVTPSFNQGPFLEQTINSVLDQKYRNLQYIVIDGGSSDNSIDVIRKYERYLAYWVSEPDTGLYHALQKGFARCSGEIMAWINSDDGYHRNAFAIVADIFRSFDQVEWLQGLPSFMDEKGRIVGVRNCRVSSKYDYLLGEYEWIQQESCFWRRTLWNKAGGRIDDSLKLAGDFELWLRFFSHAQLYNVDTVLGAFRLRTDNQLSLDRLDEYRGEVSRLLNARLDRLSRDERGRLATIRRYRQFIGRLPIVRRWAQKSYIDAFDRPHRIHFDRWSQSFTIATS